MNMELKTINGEVYDCYLIAIATVLNSMSLDYQMVSIGYWNFEYVPLSKREDSQIGNGIKPYGRRIVEGEKLFHGVEKIIGFDCAQKISAKTVIDNLLQRGKIAIIVSDAFFCFWSTYYQKIHYKHCYLIYGEEMGKYRCLDPYMNNYFFESDYEALNLETACKYVLELYSSAPTISKENILKALEQDALFLKHNQFLEQVQIFNQDLQEHFDFDNEINGSLEEKVLSPLVENVRILIRNHRGYFFMIQYLCEKADLDFEQSAEAAKVCINNWKKLRLLVMKNIYRSMKKDINEILMNTMENVLTSEREFFEVFCRDIAKNFDKSSVFYGNGDGIV